MSLRVRGRRVTSCGIRRSDVPVAAGAGRAAEGRRPSSEGRDQERGEDHRLVSLSSRPKWNRGCAADRGDTLFRASRSRSPLLSGVAAGGDRGDRATGTPFRAVPVGQILPVPPPRSMGARHGEETTTRTGFPERQHLLFPSRRRVVSRLPAPVGWEHAVTGLLGVAVDTPKTFAGRLAPSRPRTVLICHGDSTLNRDGIAQWLASFSATVHACEPLPRRAVHDEGAPHP